MRERIGDNGPLYLLAGAIVVFAIAVFPFTRSTLAKAPQPVPERHGAKSLKLFESQSRR